MEIRETLYQGADFVKEPGLFTYSDYGMPAILYPRANKAKELDDLLYDIIIRRRSRGVYKPDYGRIFLRRGSWCRDTIIHETLHSVSIFAADQNIRIANRYLFIREGLTQFLTGYVLWKKHHQCYEAWKSKVYPQWCALAAYEDMTRIWYTFCRFVNFEEIKKLYFGINSSDWNNIWREFIASINNANYKFDDPLQGRVARFQDRFVDQCRKAFGRNNFDRIFDMESSDLDYGLIISS